MGVIIFEEPSRCVTTKVLFLTLIKSAEKKHNVGHDVQMSVVSGMPRRTTKIRNRLYKCRIGANIYVIGFTAGIASRHIILVNRSGGSYPS